MGGWVTHLGECAQSNAAEATFIRGLRVSPLRQYFVLMLKDKPFELWDIASLSTIALLKASQVTALDWCPTQGTPTGALSSLFRTHTRHTHHRAALPHTSTHDPPPPMC